MTSEKLRTHIIGGGVAGLAAALRLGEGRRHEPIILERDAELGGLARSLHFKGVSTDLGPHRLHTEIPEVEALVSDICAPSLYTVKRKSRIYLRGRFLDYPPSPLEVAARLGPALMARFGFSMIGESLRPAPREETYESLMRRAFGPALYNFMLRPYSAKVWKSDPAAIHADTARVRVSAGSLAKMIAGVFRREKKGGETSLREFRYVRGGVETLVRHLKERAEAAGARLHVSRAVEGIELLRDEGGSGGQPGFRAQTVVCESNAGMPQSERRLPTDAVISTAPLPVLLENLLPQVPELATAREAAQGLTYLGIILVCIIVKRKIISGDNWLYFPEPEWIFNRAYEAKSFDPAMGPEDRSVLCVEITCRAGDEIDRTDDAGLIKETVEQLARTGLFREDEVDETLVHRLRYGYPLYSLDYHERLDAVFAGLRRIRNLLSTGRQGLFNHNNTDHSILMGLRAAETLRNEEERRMKDENVGMGDGRRPAVDEWYDAVEEFKHFRIVD